MADPFIGEIRLFAGNFAPRGWAFCNGQLLSISQNTALFSILGKVYGGDGKTNFALPNLQGRAPMHQGAGPGLTPHPLGEANGATTVTLIQSEMPVHSHPPGCDSTSDNADGSPLGNVWGTLSLGLINPYDTSANTMMYNQAIAPVGGSQPHNNMQPYLGLSFIIALQGDFPVKG